MKSKLKNILQSFINREGSFCTLCFTSVDDIENALNITDKVMLKSENEKSIVDILNFTLTPGVSIDFITNYICLQCAKLALSSYFFIKMVKENSEYLNKTIKNLTNTLKSNLEENLDCVKTIYLLNEDLMFQSCHDTKCDIKSIETAKLRLETILSEENNEDNIIIHLEPELQENKQLKNIKEKTKRNVLVNMCERDGNNVQCKLCLRAFTAMENFTRHYNRVHAPKTVKCPKCPKLFGSTSILNQHRLECHIDAICTECGKAFNNVHYLRRHELSHRINFPCEKCSRVYKTKETYNFHLKFKICGKKQGNTEPNAVFTCDICKKNFHHKSSLKVHINFTHGYGKAYVCEYCNKKFRFQSHLKAHIIKHTQVVNFPCTICDRTFGTEQGLTIHFRKHTGDKPYKCVECDSAFISSSLRSIHVQRCHREIQHNLLFECHVCRKIFKSKRSLASHKKNVKCHSKEVSSS